MGGMDQAQPHFTSQGIGKVLRGTSGLHNYFDWVRLPNPISPDVVRAAIDGTRARLQELKQLPQAVPEAPLHDAYVAGFMDADGCICLLADGKRVYSASQRWPFICEALKRKYGGKISRSPPRPPRVPNEQWHWILSNHARQEVFEERVFPLMIGKWPQAQIILDSHPGSIVESERRLSTVKGRVLLRRVPLEDGEEVDNEVAADDLDDEVQGRNQGLRQTRSCSNQHKLVETLLSATHQAILCPLYQRRGETALPLGCCLQCLS